MDCLISWKGKMAGLREGKADFSLTWDPLEASQLAIQTAFLAGTKLGFKFVDAAGTAGYGFWGDFMIAAFNFEQPLEEGTTVSVSLELDGPPTVEIGV